MTLTSSADSPLHRVGFRPMRSGNTYEETIERILQTITLGVVQPGERLPSERDLAALLNISRVTLRDALRSLQDSGYVESRPGRNGGTFVLRRPPAGGDGPAALQPTAAEAQDVLDVRWILERGACEFAANRVLAPEERKALWSSLEECAAAAPEEYRPLDSRLHLTIAELSGVPSLAALAADNRERVNKLLDAIPLLPLNIVHSNQQHTRIVNAILRGDPPAAVAEMESHLHGTSSLITGFLG